MFETIQGLLGFVLFLSFLSIIKPSWFHRLHKGLTRKQALVVFIALFITTNVTSLVFENGIEGQSPESVALQEDQRIKAAEKKKAEEERLKAEEAATLETIKKITITGRITHNSIGTPELRVSIKNGTDKTIDALTFQTYFTNNFGDPVGEWNRKTIEPFVGVTQDLIKPGATSSAGYWNLAVYDSATKLVQPLALRVHFTDGTEIVNPTID